MRRTRWWSFCGRSGRYRSTDTLLTFEAGSLHDPDEIAIRIAQGTCADVREDGLTKGTGCTVKIGDDLQDNVSIRMIGRGSIGIDDRAHWSNQLVPLICSERNHLIIYTNIKCDLRAVAKCESDHLLMRCFRRDQMERCCTRR